MEFSKEGFKLVTGTDGKKTLLFDSERAEESCNFLIKNKLNRISIYPGVYKAADLGPLLPLIDHVEGLLLSEKISYNYINQFKLLKFLSIQDNKRDKVDLSNFPELETLSSEINKRIVGLESCKKLKVFFLNDYKPETKNLTALPTLDKIEYLGLFNSTIASLEGIEHFPNLSKILFYGLSKLTSIKELKKVSRSLLEIEIQKCKKISDYEIIGDLSKAQKIIITESGQITSLEFVRSLKNLRLISFWGTNVIDGNIDHCEGIDFVGFDNKRHYNHKSEDFKK